MYVDLTRNPNQNNSLGFEMGHGGLFGTPSVHSVSRHVKHACVSVESGVVLYQRFFFGGTELSCAMYGMHTCMVGMHAMPVSDNCVHGILASSAERELGGIGLFC